MNYRDLMELDIPVAAAIIKYGTDWTLEKVNHEFAELFGCGVDDASAIDENGLIMDRDRYVFEETLEQAVRGRTSVRQELRILRERKKEYWVEIRCKRLSHVDAVPYLLVMFWDINEQKAREQEQALLNEKYQMMEKLSQEFPFDVDVESWTMLRPGRLMEMRGEYSAVDRFYPVEEEVQFLHEDDRELFLKTLREAAHKECSGTIDTRFQVSMDSDGMTYVWFRTFYKSVADEEDNIVRIIGRSFNIDQDKQLQDEVRRDPLTKLLNKMEMQREVTSFLAEHAGGTHAMFLIDIDNFKGINDTFGHTFGDTVITDVATMIQEQFRTSDLVGRVGGDEFLVFMKDTTLEKAVEKAQVLCCVLAKDYNGGSVDYHISISVGLAMYGTDGSTYSAMFEKADHAMYRAKVGGKNGFEIANASDVGPIHSGTRVIERREVMSREDQEFLTFATSLMAHARNLDVSMNMLLKRIAERYNLDLVAMFEDSEDQAEIVMTNYYGSQYSFYDKSVIPLSISSIRELQAGNYLILTNEQLDVSEQKAGFLKTSQYLKADQPFSTVIVKFEFVGERTGEIFFMSLDEDREWQQGELEMMQELTRTISIFVSLRFRMDESAAQIRHIQKRDQLTDLYNQDAFKRKAVALIDEEITDKIYAFEYLDVNNFGYMNENYGYKVGDNILKMLTADIVRQPYFVAGCRLYSDFFLFLFKDDSKESLEEHVRGRNKRFLNMMNHQYPASGMGITAGVYIVDDPKHMQVDLAIENANLAWKYAKNNGIRDYVFFDPKMRTVRAEEQQVIGEFFEALYRDDFQVYLQPKFILGDRTIYGAEALARWKRPDGKVLPPAVFIDSLERIGYITELDFYIFEELLRTMDRWRKQKRRQIIVSTNFSGRHFEGDGEEFLARIAHIISKYSISPNNIEIEVTESVLVKNIGTLQKCVERLHQMGFRVAIDDFGSGYSSLSVLADIQADVVKIDKSFINKDMTERKLSLLYEIGQMVKILEKDIIIEGVETQEQENYLKQRGFTCGQGYLCNRPIPAGEFEQLYM